LELSKSKHINMRSVLPTAAAVVVVVVVEAVAFELAELAGALEVWLPLRGVVAWGVVVAEAVDDEDVNGRYTDLAVDVRLRLLVVLELEAEDLGTVATKATIFLDGAKTI
jgi:hypothetical protein